MATLVIRFPGGRYHATATGHHVNEGIVEWPPSPWRLARALLACGYTTQRWREVPAAGRRLLEALASVLPEYRLPSAALGHSRHYMPIGVLDKGREKTTLVLDTFADVGRGELWVRWPVKLDAESEALLGVLAAHLGYLGRAESWVLAESVSDDARFPDGGRAFPHEHGARPARGYEQVTLTAPDRPEDYARWRDREVEAALVTLPMAKKRPTKKELKARHETEETYPRDLLDCMERDTKWWKDRRWSQAPGTTRVLYWRDVRALEVGPPATTRRPIALPVEMVLLALTTPSGSRTALPTISRTLPQAELLHKGLVAQLGFGIGSSCPELTGRDETGQPLSGHRHAHVMPVDLDGDGHLDHVLLFARMGLGSSAQQAVRSLKRTYTKGGVGALRVAVAGQGSLEDLRALPGAIGAGIASVLGSPKGAARWISATPFVPPRHIKKRGAGTLEGQVLAELRSRELPPARVEVLPWNGATLRLRHVVRRRRAGAPQPPVDLGYVLRLHFERPITGPLCLGYGSHFGLGRFADETRAPSPSAVSANRQADSGA